MRLLLSVIFRYRNPTLVWTPSLSKRNECESTGVVMIYVDYTPRVVRTRSRLRTITVHVQRQKHNRYTHADGAHITIVQPYRMLQTGVRARANRHAHGARARLLR